MFTFLDPRVWVAAMVAAAIAFGGGYFKGRASGKTSIQAQWDKSRAADAIAVQQRQMADAASALQASQSFQQELSRAKPSIQRARQVVIRTVAGPCLPADSVRSINAAIAGELPASAASR